MDFEKLYDNLWLLALAYWILAPIFKRMLGRKGSEQEPAETSEQAPPDAGWEEEIGDQWQAAEPTPPPVVYEFPADVQFERRPPEPEPTSQQRFDWQAIEAQLAARQAELETLRATIAKGPSPQAEQVAAPRVVASGTEAELWRDGLVLRELLGRPLRFGRR